MIEGSANAAEAVQWYSRFLRAPSTARAKYALAVARAHGTPGLLGDPKLFVGTIHSFKGAEADIVFVYPDLSGTGMRAWLSRGEQRDSVVRMFYVALTRAREACYVSLPASPRSADLWVGLS